MGEKSGRSDRAADAVGADAGQVFWDLVEGRARLAALEEIEGAFKAAGHSTEVLALVARRKRQVGQTIDALVEEARTHHGGR